MTYTIINTPLINKTLSPNPSYLAVKKMHLHIPNENQILQQLTPIYNLYIKKRFFFFLNEEPKSSTCIGRLGENDAVMKIKEKGRKPNPVPIEFSLKYQFFSLFPQII